MNASSSVNQFWEIWEIRILILTSLLIQALLTFFAPLRKRYSKGILKFFISMLYLLADVIAVYTIGLISNYRCHHYAQTTELLSLWASFLLLHLGGPDTITALALEDNELWRRHALQLATQVTVTVYVFMRSLQTKNSLWLPTVLVFVHGFIKYFERTRSLFYASRESFRDSIGKILRNPEFVNNTGLKEEYFSNIRAHIPAEIQFENDLVEDNENFIDEEDDPDTSLEDDLQWDAGGKGGNRGDYKIFLRNKEKKEWMIREAHVMYDMYKPLLAEGFLSLRDRQRSRKIMFSYPQKDAFRLIEIELNLIYDTFYTKSFLLQKKLAVFRFICFLMIVASSVLFLLKCGSVRHKTDIIISVTLFCGAITLDICTFIMFVGSDWWIIEHSRQGPRMKNIMGKLLYISRRFRNYESKRWSNTMSKHNLLKFCFRKPPFLEWSFDNKITRTYCACFDKKFLRDLYRGLVYVDTTSVRKTHRLVEFITQEIWWKAKIAGEVGEASKLFSARGSWVLENKYFLASECLSPWTVDISYDKSLMVWHLATDICYWAANRSESESREKAFDFSIISKELSDYMLYLLICQQSLLSSVVGGMPETQFHHTCWAAQKFMGELEGGGESQNSRSEIFKRFSDKVIQNPEDLELTYNLGGSQDVLFEACRLAKQLKMFGDLQWEITSKVWVELLCYAASHCSPRTHIARLNEGGELITLVWLFMAHLGIGENFSQNERKLSRLVIDK